MKTSEQILDMYYLDARCMLIEVAALLDRCDRANSTSAGESNGKTRAAEGEGMDSRLSQIYQTLQYLGDPELEANRSEHVLNLFTDED